jgi:hypothetical protein
VLRGIRRKAATHNAALITAVAGTPTAMLEPLTPGLRRVAAAASSSSLSSMKAPPPALPPTAAATAPTDCVAAVRLRPAAAPEHVPTTTGHQKRRGTGRICSYALLSHECPAGMRDLLAQWKLVAAVSLPSKVFRAEEQTSSLSSAEQTRAEHCALLHESTPAPFRQLCNPALSTVHCFARLRPASHASTRSLTISVLHEIIGRRRDGT